MTAIEINDEDDANDGGYVSDSEPTISSSLVSSVSDFIFEYGRRFHKFHEGAYLFPNDEREQEREDMKHSMIVSLCGGKLHYAPLESPHRILDVGTGTGVWAIDSMIIQATFLFFSPSPPSLPFFSSFLGFDLIPVTCQLMPNSSILW